MATAFPMRRPYRARRRRVAQASAGPRDGQGARRPRVRSDLVVDVHCGSQVLYCATEMRWSHAFFERITRQLHAPGAPRYRSTKPAMAGDQILCHDPPMFHLMVSRNPGERNRDVVWLKLRQGNCGGVAREESLRTRSEVRSMDLDCQGSETPPHLPHHGRPSFYPFVLTGSKNINANSSDQARAHFPVRRLIELR